jgi:hypothetical protein
VPCEPETLEPPELLELELDADVLVPPELPELLPELLELLEPPELLELPKRLRRESVAEAVGLTPAALLPVAAVLPASLEPPQPARAMLRVTNARPWPSHPRLFSCLPFLSLFMLLAPLFR